MAMDVESILEKLKGVALPTVEGGGAEPTAKTPVSEDLQEIQNDSIKASVPLDVQLSVQQNSPVIVPPPSEGFQPAAKILMDPELFAALFTKVESDVMRSILDAWHANLQEQKDMDKKYLEQKIKDGWDRMGQFASAYTSKEESQVAGVGAAQLVVANLTAFTLLSQFTVTQLAGVQNVQSAFAIHNLSPEIFAVTPAEFQNLIAMVGGIVGGGVLAPITVRLATAQASGTELTHQEFANEISFQTINLIRQTLLEKVLRELSAGGLTADQYAQLGAKLNLNFLLNALVMFYTKETGWISKEELLDLIQGGNLFQAIEAENPSDPRLALVRAIQKELGLLSETEREAFLKSSVEFFTRNPSYENSRELHELLGKMRENLDYERLNENRV